MRQKSLLQNVILVGLFLVFSGCKIEQQPTNGVAQGYDKISVAAGNEERYDFFISSGYYGYFTVNNISGIPMIYAPYGVYMTGEDLSTAPSEGYVYAEQDLSAGYYYIIRPDSLHYGKLYIESISYTDTSADINFQWWLQTQENVRDFQ